MKKQNFKLLAILLVLIFTGSFYKSTSAYIMPYLDINFTIQTDRGDGLFEIKVDNYDPGTTEPFETKSKKISTLDKVATTSLSFYVSNGSKVITQINSTQNFKLKSANCTSNNPDLIYNYKNNQIEITAKPYTKVSCVIDYKNGREPVIIVPGVLSSVLSRNDDNKTELWPNIKKIILNLFGDDFLNELALNDIGQPNMDYPIVLPTDILRNIQNKDFFLGLINQLKSDGYVEGQDLFVFPYDWRLDIRQMVDSSYTPLVPSLKEKIDEIIVEAEIDKVDIIAHSMGGLLTKYYLNKYSDEGKVNKFIDIATPHLGSPNAFKTLFAGDDLGIKFGFLGLNQNKIKEISRNMPSIYQLLPSANYFDEELPDYKYYVYDFDDYDSNQEKGRLDFNQTKDFLKNLNKNSLLLDQADNLHQSLDGLIIDDSIETYNIVGCAKPTISKFFISNQNEGKYKIDLDYTSGDGTVPERSAKSFKTDQVFTVNDVQHAMMPSNEGIRNLVSAILQDKVEDYNYEKFNYVSNNNDYCELGDGDIYVINGPLKLADEVADKLQPDTFDNNLVFFAPADAGYELFSTSNSTSASTIKIKKRRGGRVEKTLVFDSVLTSSTSTRVISEPESDKITIENPGSTVVLPPTTIVPGDTIDDLILPEKNTEITSTSTLIIEKSSHRTKKKKKSSVGESLSLGLATTSIATIETVPQIDNPVPQEVNYKEIVVETDPEKTNVATDPVKIVETNDNSNYASVLESKSNYGYMITLILFLLTILIIYKIKNKNKNE